MATVLTLIRFTLTVALMAITCYKMADACSCMMSHPQDQFCNSDFVIVARVKSFNNKDSYKIRVKKEFKTNEKVTSALKSGRVMTSPESSLCGVHLVVNETYVMAGRIVAGSPRISLCDFVKPFSQVTNRQRKGFNVLYKQACGKCEIVNCPQGRTCPHDKEVCYWSTMDYGRLPDCQAERSVCMLHSNGNCNWTHDNQYRECMKKRRFLRNELAKKKP